MKPTRTSDGRKGRNDHPGGIDRPAHQSSLPALFAFACVVGVGTVATMLATGCGYRHGPIFSEDVGTVAVEAFHNRAYYQGVEFSLTEAIKKQIEVRTPYKVTRIDGADTLLSGEIVRISQTTLSRQHGGLPQDVEYRVVVNFEWKNLRSGEVLRQRRGMEVVAPYGPARQIGEPQTMGQHRVVQRIADRVVSVMMANM